MTSATGTIAGDRMAERLARLLDERTALLARRGGGAARAPDAVVLACQAGEEAYGLPLAAVAEVLPARPVVQVPGVVAPVLGAIGLGGRLASVIGLRVALGLPQAEETAPGHLLRLRHGARRLVLQVDRALAVVPVFAVAGPAGAPEATRRGVSGYAVAPAGTLGAQETLIGLLDLDALLAPVLRPSLPSGA
jgi:purine-binding chemotaxis protein CheW